MVDVMRGAIAEVEDYARVSVATRSQAALAGSAVADVIHLLAELIENATTLSPPYTSVRVSGDTVANGFAIEVEDRGLGMSPERRAEFNARLARPPEFNPADSEQLGLFVVSQLARRHGIGVMLQVSPYGGITAVALIPPHLVVTEAAFRAGQPGLTAAVDRPPAELAGPAELRALSGLGPAPGIRISGPLRHAQDMPPELAHTELAHTELAHTELAQAELAEPEPAETGWADAEPAEAEPAFDVFLPRQPGAAYLAAPTPMIPVASPPADRMPDPGAGFDDDDLPRRVRQASLAPQLRSQADTGSPGSPRRSPPAGGEPPRERTPEDIRRSMSDLQRGWQEGRAEHTYGGTDGT